MSSVIFGLVGIYVVLALVLYLFQSHLVYFPIKTIMAVPADIGLPYESVAFHAQDGTQLSGWFIPAARQRGIVLFCHGNGGNISHRLEKLQMFNKLNLSTFIFDYRGYGKSEGKPTEAGTYLDAGAAWDYLLQKRGGSPESIILYGESLGGAVAAWLAKDRNPGALILSSVFTSVPDLASGLYSVFPVRLLSRFKYSTISYLGQVKSPVLIVHSPDDEIVPFSHGRRLFSSANTPKEFLEIRGDHNSGFIRSENTYVNGLNVFLSKHLKEQDYLLH